MIRNFIKHLSTIKLIKFIVQYIYIYKLSDNFVKIIEIQK